LAVANETPGSVSVLLGRGDGTFGTARHFGTGGTPQSVSIGDANLDRKLDLVVANLSSNTVSVLLGDGYGAFGTKTDFGTGNGPRSVAIGDVNRDLKPDLVTANSSSYTVSVLLNVGQESSGVCRGFESGVVRVLAPKPNPSHSTTTIEFDSPASAPFTLEILDVSGRLTRVLSTGVKYPAGRHALIWDGHDETGRPVASGIYFVRLRAGRQSGMQKILMVR
jgi:hypothetical protein